MTPAPITPRVLVREGLRLVVAVLGVCLWAAGVEMVVMLVLWLRGVL